MQREHFGRKVEHFSTEIEGPCEVFLPVFQHPQAQYDQLEWSKAMFKRTLICVAFTFLCMPSLKAQRLEANLQRIEVPGAEFEILLATPKAPAVTINLGESPEAMVIPLVGNALTLIFEDGAEMIATLEYLRYPGYSLMAPSPFDKPPRAAALYIVPKGITERAPAR